jgi:hypothetical protein
MRDVAIKKIIKELQDRGVDFSSIKALDFFAREGDWQTSSYASLVDQIHAWEIESNYESALKKNLPKTAKIKIGDSYELAKVCQEKFDLIVLDNPQGCFGNDYCEHFEAIEAVKFLMNDSCLLIFNVKTKPFDYEDKLIWRKKRDNFYGTDASELSEEFVHQFYKKYFQSLGWTVEFSFLTARPQEEGLSAYTAKLTRKDRN